MVNTNFEKNNFKSYERSYLYMFKKFPKAIISDIVTKQVKKK